ncbi:MAG: hypothetical protein H8D54_03055 [Candidatus Omnitrophica bacterium]|nr:hypothetical protein [Candidatus Omnitrophota bacterium]
MANENNQEKRFNLEEFSKKSEAVYSSIKAELELTSKGKYVALDPESRRHWIGNTPTEALTKAKEDFPGKLFYLLQIGSPTTFSIQSIISRSCLKPKYDFAWQY